MERVLPGGFEPFGDAASDRVPDRFSGLRFEIRPLSLLGVGDAYGNTEFEKLYLFGKLLLPLLDYGRERVDFSALKMTHHKLRDLGQQRLNLAGGDPAGRLKPPTHVGSGQAQERQKQRLEEIIRGLNSLFEGELTDGDRVAFAESVQSKLMESATLRAQATANTREQFGNSPSLREELLNAIIATMEAHGSMSRQALNSEATQAGLLAVLLGPGALWETLRKEGGRRRA